MFHNFLLLFARLFGFFFLSPLFPKRYIPSFVRLGISLVSSLFLLPAFHSLSDISVSLSPSFSIFIIKEIMMGFLFGFLFSLLFEALSFAGQLLSIMGGFSITEILDFSSQENQTPITKLYLILGSVLFLSLDLHHILLRFLFESFLIFPVATLALNENSIEFIISASSRLFHYGFSYAAIPFSILFFISIIMAIFSRQYIIFLNSLSLQLLVAIMVIAFSISSFPELFLKNFNEFFAQTKKVLFPL